MVHKTEVVARCRRLGRVREARLAPLARAGSGASGDARPSNRALL